MSCSGATFVFVFVCLLSAVAAEDAPAEVCSMASPDCVPEDATILLQREPQNRSPTPTTTKAVNKALMAQKMGMNCNAAVNSPKPTWKLLLDGSSTDACKVLKERSMMRLDMCKKLGEPLVDCTIVDWTESRKSKKKGECTGEDGIAGKNCRGECKLLACPEAQLTDGSLVPAASSQGTSSHQTYMRGPAVNAHTLDPFTELSSWFWTYGLIPNEHSLKWAQQHGKEFVPLVNLKEPIPKERGVTCTLLELDTNKTCTVAQFVELLEETKGKITTSYLMGYNEPYAGSSEDTHGQERYGGKGSKHITPEQGAEVWRRIVQPAAEETKLKLVSPTTGISGQKADWLIKFMQHCYDKRDALDGFPCDVTKIGVWSIHEYKCYGSYWRKYAAVDGGESVEIGGGAEKCGGELRATKNMNIYQNFKQAMREQYGHAAADTFWDPYISSVKLWVTEHSCGGDNRYNKVKKKMGLDGPPNSTEQCRFITGQDCHREEGSIQAMLELPNIERFSWFTLLANPPPEHPNYESIRAGRVMDFATGEPTPIGRALIGALDPEEAQCDGLQGS